MIKITSRMSWQGTGEEANTSTHVSSSPLKNEIERIGDIVIVDGVDGVHDDDLHSNTDAY